MKCNNPNCLDGRLLKPENVFFEDILWAQVGVYLAEERKDDALALARYIGNYIPAGCRACYMRHNPEMKNYVRICYAHLKELNRAHNEHEETKRNRRRERRRLRKQNKNNP